MRIRQVKPAFWSDSKLAGLPEPVRLFFIGLWMLADDAGWLRWDPAEVGKELYGYQSRVKREGHVVKYLAALEAIERVVVHPCGHVLVPRLALHQRFGGPDKRVYTIRTEHSNCLPAEPRGGPPPPARYGKGTVREGTERSAAQARDDESEFQSRVGRPAFLGGKS